ncbi:hypothetical protein C8R47DRAFT_1218517 [Mycena vitilis]|nr:hypothetical protein C8R47DRAFT_1218517 [Mycena vitilis]
MIFLLPFFPLLLSIRALAAPTDLGSRSIKMNCNRDAASITRINQELQYASDMAEMAANALSNPAYTSEYWTSFFPPSLRNEPQFLPTMKVIYTRLAKVYKPDQRSYPITITCTNDHTACTTTRTVAYVNDGMKTLNFCDRFFTDPTGTDDAVADCRSATPQMMHDLNNFRMTTSHILAHEGTHTRYVMGKAANVAQDYAYGVNRCIALANGVFNRANAKDQKQPPLCPDITNPTKEGLCHPDLAATNADSISLFSTAVYYSARCGAPVSLPPPAEPGSDDDSDDSDYVPSSGESSGDESMSDGDDSDAA